jgi:hypothetical protein
MRSLGQQVRLATVGGVAIAIPKGRCTAAHRTRAVEAGRGRVGEVATHVACAAVCGVGLGVDTGPGTAGLAGRASTPICAAWHTHVARTERTDGTVLVRDTLDTRAAGQVAPRALRHGTIVGGRDTRRVVTATGNAHAAGTVAVASRGARICERYTLDATAGVNVAGATCRVCCTRGVRGAAYERVARRAVLRCVEVVFRRRVMYVVAHDVDRRYIGCERSIGRHICTPPTTASLPHAFESASNATHTTTRAR